MGTLEWGVIVALFSAVLGAYIFIFKVSNDLNHQVDDLKVEVTDRLARVEEQLKTIFKVLNKRGG